MIDRIYIEEQVSSCRKVEEIKNRFPDASIVYCDSYSEVFNRNSQSFRLQKIRPALILAKKQNRLVLPAPEEFGIGGDYNFYFSHMMNCIYDCRYCFLQGMYQSANFVLFVNYDDFADAIIKTAGAHPDKTVHFFSGYDCDSLALEPVSGFVDFILPVFGKLTNALLEVRTKSTQIRSLLATTPLDNCVIAYSLNPASIASAIEIKAPDPAGRLKALHKLQLHGWKIGLRFDPLIYHSGFKEDYRRFFFEVFSLLDRDMLHSVSLGTFRLPADYFRKILRDYPNERLFASPMDNEHGIQRYKDGLRQSLLNFCYTELLQYIPSDKLFPCEPLN